jgi:hypothetical protein
MIQAFSLIFNFYNIASPCGDMIKIFILELSVSFLVLWTSIGLGLFRVE